MHPSNRLSAPPTRRQRPPGHSPLVPHTRFLFRDRPPGRFPHIRRGNHPTPRRLPDGFVYARPPVSPFVDARRQPRVRLSPRRVRRKASAPPGRRIRRRHCLAVSSPVPKDRFYLGHTPMLQRCCRSNGRTRSPSRRSSRILLTPPTMRGTGHHTGGCSTSRVSLVLRFQGRVASRCYPAGRSSYVRFSRSGIVSVANRATWHDF